MNIDNIEEYVRQNREDFDDREPSPLVWSRIQNELDKKKAETILIRIPRWSAVAAFIAIVLAVGIAIGYYAAPSPVFDQNIAAQLGDAEEKRFSEVSTYYGRQVNQKIDEIKDIDSDSEVLNDIEQLDGIFNELKAELAASQGDDAQRIIDAMIINYQTKIEILEKVLNRLNREHLEKQSKNDGLDI